MKYNAVYTAMMPCIPPPLTLIHGPLLVTIKEVHSYYGPGEHLFIAELPCCNLDSESKISPAHAMLELGDLIYSFIVTTIKIPPNEIGGGLLKELQAIKQLIFIPYFMYESLEK